MVLVISSPNLLYFKLLQEPQLYWQNQIRFLCFRLRSILKYLYSFYKLNYILILKDSFKRKLEKCN